jgi:hypothetical protein
MRSKQTKNGRKDSAEKSNFVVSTLALAELVVKNKRRQKGEIL